MTKFLMIAGVAAMAASMPAVAKPDNANKGGGGGGQAQASHPGKGGGGHKGGNGAGPGKAAKTNIVRVDRAQQQPRSQQSKLEKAQQRQVKADRQVVRQAKADRSDARDYRRSDRVPPTYDRGSYDRNWDDRDRWASGQAANCPPGLAKKRDVIKERWKRIPGSGNFPLT